MFLVVNILKFDINCTFFFWDYFQLTKPKPKSKTGALPQTPLTLAEAAGACGKTYPHSPGLSVVDSKASRVKCTTASPLTPFHLLGCSKTIRSGRSRKPVKACEEPRSGLAFTGWRRPNALWLGCRGCRRRRLHPCHVANAGGQRPRFGQAPRGRVVGGRCAKGTHFRVMVL